MRFIARPIAAAALAASLATLPAHARAADIEVHRAWTRATPPGAPTAGGYMVVRNTGATGDRILGGSTPIAERVEVHEMAVVDGVMKMRALADGLAVPAGGEVTLAPGGHHLMLIGLRDSLKAGTTVPLTLTFEKAGDLRLDLSVAAIGGMPGHGAAAAGGQP
ncbi:copper chaperone PCu(A)C [Arenibaculum pallidiluteum]|uniref:copper chaperone PCu(A)C n=1 Tax=Arenibaculum pallidiluteum TaxID=2812559 RepID=UPI001A971FF9|nr:copper chaperone PCu(A)C [Arenibaculum pallidiluteum]